MQLEDQTVYTQDLIVFTNGLKIDLIMQLEEQTVYTQDLIVFTNGLDKYKMLRATGLEIV